MAISRKDPKGRKLREGENWRNDGRYSYRYTDVRTGKRLTVYAQDLPELREKEKRLQRIWKIIYDRRSNQKNDA